MGFDHDYGLMSKITILISPQLSHIKSYLYSDLIRFWIHIMVWIRHCLFNETESVPGASSCEWLAIIATSQPKSVDPHTITTCRNQTKIESWDCMIPRLCMIRFMFRIYVILDTWFEHYCRTMQEAPWFGKRSSRFCFFFCPKD